MKKKITLVLALIVLFCGNAPCQNKVNGLYQIKIDSILSVINNSNSNEVLFDSYINLGKLYRNKGNLDSALIIYNTIYKKKITAVQRNKVLYLKSIAYADFSMNDSSININIKALSRMKNNIGYDTSLETNILNELGWNYINNQDYEKSFNTFQKLKAIGEKQKNIKTIAKSYHGLSNTYYYIGNNEKYVEYSISWFEFAEKSKDTIQMAKACSGIGYALLMMKDWDGCEKYMLKALDFAHKINDSYIKTYSLSILAIVYRKRGEYEKSIQISKEIIKSNKDVGYDGYADSYTTLGAVFLEMKMLDSALYYINISIHKNLLNKLKYEAIDDYYIKAHIFDEIGKLDSSIYYFNKGIQIGKEINASQMVIEGYVQLKKTYIKHGNSVKLLEIEYILQPLLDSIELTENNQQQKFLYSSMELSKKEDEIKQLYINQKISEVNAKNKDKLILIFSAVVLFAIVVIVFILWVLIKIRTKNRIILEQKALVDEANEELNQTNEELAAQRDQIEHQRKDLQLKNEEISASINYAKRIQEAILPSMESMNKSLKDGFVLYQPKDVVAGDFFWMEEYMDKVYVAAADCTGHGVPGAMVSVVCSNALSKALLEDGNTDTGKLLDRTRELVIHQLSKSGEEVKDGMDISLCSIDFNNMKIQWSGANNPLYILRGNEILETKGDKQPIGNYIHQVNFKAHSTKIQNGDCIYLFTDGYADQFGGPEGKKFSYSQFRTTLLEISTKNMDEQKSILLNKLQDWKNQANEEQVDDICVIGIKVY